MTRPSLFMSPFFYTMNKQCSVDVYLDTIALPIQGIDAIGIECFSNGVQFSDTRDIMRVYFDDICWAKEFSLIVEMHQKPTKVSGKRKK